MKNKKKVVDVVEEAARKYSTSNEYPNSVWLKQGFMAGAAWAFTYLRLREKIKKKGKLTK